MYIIWIKIKYALYLQVEALKWRKDFGINGNLSFKLASFFTIIEVHLCYQFHSLQWDLMFASFMMQIFLRKISQKKFWNRATYLHTEKTKMELIQVICCARHKFAKIYWGFYALFGLFFAKLIRICCQINIYPQHII